MKYLGILFLASIAIYQTCSGTCLRYPSFFAPGQEKGNEEGACQKEDKVEEEVEAYCGAGGGSDEEPLKWEQNDEIAKEEGTSHKSWMEHAIEETQHEGGQNACPFDNKNKPGSPSTAGPQIKA